MFTQLLGNYLLNEKLLTPEQLNDVLDFQKSVHVKLGVMAVNSGFMTGDDVNKVHKMQSKVDKKFGELAIEMGFLNEEQLEILLSTQKSGHLLIGQSILDKNYMTLVQFEEALNNYKRAYSITNKQFNSLINEDLDEVINTFYNFDNCTESDLYKNYFSLLIRNVIRFIDSDFKPLEIIPINSYKFECLASQETKGNFKLCSCISADEKTFIQFASKYAREDLKLNDEYTQASVGEFLNLVNGIFIVNMSNDNIELELNPQTIHLGKSLTGLSEAYCIPVEFSFGKIDFIISKSSPVIV
jgi:hypothetical protein